MSHDLMSNFFKDLSDENFRLLTELSFERQLNEKLEKFRKYSLDLKTNCFCRQNKQTFDLLDQLDVEYKKLLSSKKPNNGAVDEITSTSSANSKADTNKPDVEDNETTTEELPQNDNQSSDESIGDPIVIKTEKPDLVSTQTTPQTKRSLDGLNSCYVSVKRLKLIPKVVTMSDINASPRAVEIKTTPKPLIKQEITSESGSSSGVANPVVIRPYTKTKAPNMAFLKDVTTPAVCAISTCDEVFNDLRQYCDHWFAAHVQNQSSPPFKCSFSDCRVWVETAEEYQRHLDDIHNIYKCNICGKGFAMEVMLSKHERSCTLASKLMHWCTVCKQRYQTNEELDQHMTDCHVMCETCLTWHTDDELLLRHQQMYERTDIHHLCGQCHQLLLTEQNLVLHNHWMHNQPLVRCTDNDCDYVTDNESDLQSHDCRPSHTKSRKAVAKWHSYCFLCPHKPKMISEEKLRDHLMAAHKIHRKSMPYLCRRCPLVFEVLPTFVKHVSTCTSDSAECYVVCRTCHSWHKNKEELIRHSQLFSRTDIDYMCGECHQLLITENNMVLHNHWIHAKHLMKCNSCDFVTHSAVHLGKHKKYHNKAINYSKQVIFPCFECQLQFTTEDRVRNHLNDIHKYPRNAMQYLCKTCPQVFESKSLMLKHVDTCRGPKACRLVDTHTSSDESDPGWPNLDNPDVKVKQESPDSDSNDSQSKSNFQLITELLYSKDKRKK